MHAAWRRQWLPRWQQVNNYTAALTAATTFSATAARPSLCRATIAIPHHRCLSSADAAAAAAGGHDSAPPKPRASSRWGNQRRSDHHEQKHASASQRRRRHHNNDERLKPSFRAAFDDKKVSSTTPPPPPPTSIPSFNSDYVPPRPYNDPEIAKICSRIIACRTIESTVELAYSHLNLDNLSPHVTCVFWKKISSLLGKRGSNFGTGRHHHNGNNNMKQQMNALLRHTIDGIDEYNPVDLRNVAQALASIAKSANMKGRKTMMYDIFVKNSASFLFWERVQDRTLELMEAFRPKWLVTIAWSFATVLDPLTRSSGNNDLDVSPFFHSLHKTFNQQREKFTSKHMGNLAWSCMTCRQNIPPLLNDFSNEFISRRKQEAADHQMNENNHANIEDTLDPMTLCQWANAFAKASHKDDELFQSISDAAVPCLWEFEPRQFSNLAYACALAGVVPRVYDGSSLFDAMAVAAVPVTPAFSPQNMANLLWGYAKMGQASPELFDAVGSVAMPRLEEFSPQQLANLAWAFSKFPTPTSFVVFDGISEEIVCRGLDSFTSQGLAMLAHSFATVGHVTNNRFWDSIDHAATTRVSELGPIECSQIAWSFATIGRPSDDLFHGIQSVASSKLNYTKPQGLSNLAWSFAVLGYDDPPDFFEAIAQQTLQKLDEFSPQDTAILVLAYSRIRHPFPELFDQIASNSVSQLSTFSGLDIFNMVMSYAKAGCQSKSWMKAIANEIVSRPSDFSPQMIVGIAWAYASAGFTSPDLFRVLGDECINHCDKLETKEVASLAWSFASIGCFHRQLFEALADSSDGKWQHFDAPSLANMAWAYATAQEDRPRLFEGISEAAILRNAEFTPQGVSMCLWASASLGRVESPLFDVFAPRVRALLNECDSQALANIAWSYSVANVNAPALFDEHFTNILLDKMKNCDTAGLRQLYQWNLWQKEEKSAVGLPPEFEEQCYEEFVLTEAKVSALQKDVVSVLDSVGLAPKEEQLTQRGYSLDAIVVVNGREVGVEVDGPSHFIGREPTGSTILKQRQVTNVEGITLVSVPYWEWNELGSDLHRKQRYLRYLLGMK